MSRDLFLKSIPDRNSLAVFEMNDVYIRIKLFIYLLLFFWGGGGGAA